MATGYAVPNGAAGTVSTLITALEAKAGITDASLNRDIEAGNLMALIKVTGSSVRAVSAAIRADYFAVDVGAASAGTFSLTVDGQTTAAIAYNASAAAVKAALELLSTVTTVTVTGVGTSASPWVIEFDTGDTARTFSGAVVSALTGGALTVTNPVANVHIWRDSVVAA